LTSYLQTRVIYPPQIASRPSSNLGIVVVIPAHDEEYLLLSLMALLRCKLPGCDVEVIVIVNGSEADKAEVRERNLRCARRAEEWAGKVNSNRLRFHILYFLDLPKKQAGVGTARKIGMDEACWRFESLGRSSGVIACFDADSRCDVNYLAALETHFETHPQTPACSIYFEHPLEGADFDDEVYEAIAQYELHLRYYINAQRYTGFPFAYQTIGSSMAVRCDAYQRQGGMNRRQAGEDFYFLHKFTSLEHFSEINATRVIPSPRPSHRVPFGTGKAVGEMLKSRKSYHTYAPATFQALRGLFDVVPQLYKVSEDDLQIAKSGLPESVRVFLEEMDFDKNVAEINAHTGSPESFRNRFFRWFNAFQVMKFAHFSRERYHPDVPVEGAANWLLRQRGVPAEEIPGGARALLKMFREMDRGSSG
jgi:hypothetical protein